jgi:hypothetical protein
VVIHLKARSRRCSQPWRRADPTGQARSSPGAPTAPQPCFFGITRFKDFSTCCLAGPTNRIRTGCRHRQRLERKAEREI